MGSKEHPEQSSYSDLYILIFILVLLSLKLYVLYFPFRFYEYLVPPGGDAVNHISLVKELMGGHISASYPILFHAIIAFLSKVFSQDPLQIIKVTTPLLVLLPPIAIFFFMKSNFGKISAIIAFTIALWGSNYGLVAFGDGNYPNILAGGFFMPMAFVYFLKALTKKGWKNYFWAILFVVLTLATHHLSVATFAAIFVVYILLLVIWSRYEQITPSIKRFLLAFFSIMGVGLVIALVTPLKSVLLGAISSLFANGSVASLSAFSTPIEYIEYQSMVGPFVWFGGLMSFIYLIKILGRDKEKVNKPALILIMVWFIVLFLFSRTGQSGLPGRFARETAIPLIMALSFFISYFISRLKFPMQRIFGYSIFAFIIITSMVQISGGAYRAPEFFNQMIWFTKEDKEITDFINQYTKPEDVILANQSTPYLPFFSTRKIITVNTGIFINDVQFISYSKDHNAKYLLIAPKTKANPDPGAYPMFADYEVVTKKLNAFAAQATQVYKFSNGAVLYEMP